MNWLIQKLIHRWSKKTFPNQPIFGKIEHLREELDELEVATSRYLYQRNKENRRDVLEEIADVEILMADIKERLHVNPIQTQIAVIRKMQVNTKRRWGSADDKGKYNHIKEEETT